MRYSKIFLILILSWANSNLFVYPNNIKADDPTQKTVQGLRRIDPSESDIAGTPKSLSRSLNIQSATPVIQTMSVGAGSAMINGLSGTYTIPGDFPSIEAFAAVLNFVGVSGNTIVELTNAGYLEDPVVFGPHPGQDDYTMTIRPVSGTNVVIRFKTTVDDGKGLVFTGVKDIIVDGIADLATSLTLEMASGYPFPTNDAFGATVYITAASKNITVKNANIKGLLNNPVYAIVTDGRPAIFMWADDAAGAGMQDLTFDNLTINNATYAFKALQYNWNLDYVIDGLTINNCKVGGAYGTPVAEGGLYETCMDITFTNNIIDGVDFPITFWDNGYTEWDCDGGIFYAGGTIPFMHGFGHISGSHFLIVDKVKFDNNIIRNVGTSDGYVGSGTLSYGTRVYYYNWGFYNSLSVLTNNRIYNITNPGGAGSQIVGIRGPAGHVYHNSVRITGTTAAGATSTCIDGGTKIYNNAFSNELTGISPYGVTTGGSFNYNAIYSTGRYVSAYATPNAAVLAGFNINGAFGPINFDPDLHITTGPSTAENLGGPRVLMANDIDGEARDTTGTSNRDAGADEFATLAATWGPDAFPTGLSVGTSIPTGLVQHLSVSFKNNTAVGITNLNVNLTIVPDGYNQNAVIPSISGGGTGIAYFPAWTPVSPGMRTLTARTMLANDIQPMNDTILVTTDVQTPIPIVESYTWTWDTGDEGWTRTVDWVRSKMFTKLGGPYNGYSMVTERPDKISTYTEGAYATIQGYYTSYPGPNLLTSPWLDLSGLGGNDVYIAFYLSIKIEPDWDMGWMQYTVDGKNWKHLGKLNDPNGINWYSEYVYEHAWFDPLDGYPDCYNPYQDELNIQCPYPRWTSNGTFSATGPFGYVYVQLKATQAEYPDLVHAPVVKFRFVAYSDAATAEDPGGWAFDDFRIGSTGALIQSDLISGKVFHDVNGNGTNDSEPAEAGLTVNLSYFSVPKGTTTTGVGGTYTFNTATLNNGLPGIYNVQLEKPGYAFTLPFGSTGIADVPLKGSGEIVTQDFGTYQGSVSGMKFSDYDNDSSDIEAGDSPLGGWTVEVRMDSSTGRLIGSGVTTGSGAYTILVPPYSNYFVTEAARTLTGRQNFPVGGSHVLNVSGNSGSPTANLTGINFGNFIFGKWTNEVSIDRNGNGIRESGDFLPLPFGMDLDYEVFKDNVPIDTVTLGSGNSLNIRSQLDVGEYAVKRLTPIPTGWIQTTHLDSIGFVLNTSGFNDTSNFLYFKLLTVSGVKYDDANGNGTKDGGEFDLPGWTINVSGDGGGSQVTGTGGAYLFTSVGPGVHNVTETAQAGWVATSGPYNFTAASADLPANNKIFDFGNFDQICVSGVKFRDRNNNGVKDAGEEGLIGWNINMTGQTPVVTNVNGEYQFCDVGPGTFTLTEDAQTGWLLTLPVGEQYDIVTTSGVDINNLDFGNFRESDTAMFRTFTYEQLAANLKKNKTPKPGKPILAPPNMANLLEQIMLEGAVPLIGLENVTDPVSGKLKSYLKPAKYGDIIKTFNQKGILHTGAPKGFDLDNKGKKMLKRWKYMDPTKANNLLTAQLLTLQVNIWASQLGHTPAGLGALLYTWPGILNGSTVDEIADYGNEVMTNWSYVTKETYDSLYAAVKRINEAFGNTVTDDTLQGWFPYIPSKPNSKSTWAAYRTVYEIPFLNANPGIAPRVRPMIKYEQLPVSYDLDQNYPNPFNPTTTLEFSLPVDAILTLKVYNMLGQEVAILFDHEVFYAGSEEVEYDAGQLSSGIYLYRIVAESLDDDNRTTGQVFTQVKKMVLMK